MGTPPRDGARGAVVPVPVHVLHRARRVRRRHAGRADRGPASWRGGQPAGRRVRPAPGRRADVGRAPGRARRDARRACVADGGVVTTYQPARPVQRWLGGGQHVKIQVSEAGEAIFGSSNLSRSSFEGWNEYSVAVRGPVVRTLLESYRDIGGTVDDAHLRQLDGGGARPATADLDARLLGVQPEHCQGVTGPARLARPQRRDRPPGRPDRRRPALDLHHQLLLQAGRAAAGARSSPRPGAACRSRCITRIATRCRRPTWPGSPRRPTTIACWRPACASTRIATASIRRSC